MDAKIVEKGPIYLVGYMVNAKHGFLKIPMIWHKLNKNKASINDRVDAGHLVGVNDYPEGSRGAAFDHYAMVEVSSFDNVPSDMVRLELPSKRYAVFTFIGRPQDPIGPKLEQIYNESLPESKHIRDDGSRYDMTLYPESLDDRKEGEMEIWIPIIE